MMLFTYSCELYFKAVFYFLLKILFLSQMLKKGKTHLKLEKVLKVGELYEYEWEHSTWKASVLASFEGRFISLDKILVKLIQ